MKTNTPAAQANTTAATELAMAQLRAAQLRRELTREDLASIFVHAPRAPSSATEPEHSWQRRFGPNDGPLHYKLTLCDREASRMDACVEVFRSATESTAELTLRFGIATSCETTASMTPAELRDLAERLIDAAHDIDAHPAAKAGAATAAAPSAIASATPAAEPKSASPAAFTLAPLEDVKAGAWDRVRTAQHTTSAAFA